MLRFNVLTGDLPVAADQPGHSWRGRRGVGDEAGLRWLGASVYELPAGQWTYPYHYHHGVEEWVIVVAGSPTLREPGGERELAPGDVVCLPSGPEGAHAVRGPGRVVLLSGVAAAGMASIVVYPDSDKVGTRTAQGGPDTLNFRRRDAVGYWEDE